MTRLLKGFGCEKQGGSCWKNLNSVETRAIVKGLGGQKIKDPPLDVQEINGVQEIPSQK